jgi:hypothetical protein
MLDAIDAAGGRVTAPDLEVTIPNGCVTDLHQLAQREPPV